jgi:hypothetical protein
MLCARFLLPVLQLRTILKEPTLGEMEDSLNSLSHDINEVFEGTIRRIHELPASRSRIGIESLMYLVHAAIPIPVQALSDLLAMHQSRTRVDTKYRPTESMILECCQGLVTIDPKTGYVRTSHYSVNEYLLQNEHRLLFRAEAAFAIKCLDYIMLQDFSTGPWATETEIISHIKQYPFLGYAAGCWGKHVKAAEDDNEVQATLATFLASKRSMATANQVRQFIRGYWKVYWSAEESLSLTALHHASRHGLLRTATRLLDDGIPVNALSKQGSTAVILAAAQGHVELLKLLMRKGADPYQRNWFGNALHCAVESDSEGTVRELIVGWRMDPSDPTYLACAVFNDAVRTFAALVDLGADVNAEIKWSNCDPEKCKDEDHRTHVFFFACASGSYKIVNLMIRRGWADVRMRSADGRTALDWVDHGPGGQGLAISERLAEAGAGGDAQDNSTSRDQQSGVIDMMRN